MIERAKQMKETILKDDLLFHGSHGLCRVSAILPADRVSGEVSYSILPVVASKAKVRFVVSEKSLENSGFCKLVSVHEANSILDFFKTGSSKESKNTQAWALSVTIWSEAMNKDSMKDMRKRQRLERSVKGITGELAYVLKSTVRDVADRIQKNLGPVSELNPLLVSALANVDRD